MKRNEVLKLRDQNLIITKIPVPLDDLDIRPSLFEAKRPIDNLLANKLFSDDVSFAKTSLSSPSGSSRRPTLESSLPSPTRDTSSSFLRRIRQHELYNIIQKQEMLRSRTFDQIIREERLQEEQTDSLIQQFLKQKRPLRPDRKIRRVRFVKD